MIVEESVDIEDIKKLPPAHPEIIHCRECKYTYDDTYCHCAKVTWWNSADDYCSRAKRRREE